MGTEVGIKDDALSTTDNASVIESRRDDEEGRES